MEMVWWTNAMLVALLLLILLMLLIDFLIGRVKHSCRNEIIVRLVIGVAYIVMLAIAWLMVHLVFKIGVFPVPDLPPPPSEAPVPPGLIGM